MTLILFFLARLGEKFSNSFHETLWEYGLLLKELFWARSYSEWRNGSHFEFSTNIFMQMCVRTS